MRVIAIKTLKRYWERHPQAKQQLLAWYEEMETGRWHSHQELKLQYRNASVLDDKRIVFNIHGNKYRLIVKIEYRIGLVFILWFGTHAEYDKIDAKTITYAKARKK